MREHQLMWLTLYVRLITSLAAVLRVFYYASNEIVRNVSTHNEVKRCNKTGIWRGKTWYDVRTTVHSIKWTHEITKARKWTVIFLLFAVFVYATMLRTATVRACVPMCNVKVDCQCWFYFLLFFSSPFGFWCQWNNLFAYTLGYECVHFFLRTPIARWSVRLKDMRCSRDEESNIALNDVQATAVYAFIPLLVWPVKPQNVGHIRHKLPSPHQPTIGVLHSRVFEIRHLSQVCLVWLWGAKIAEIDEKLRERARLDDLQSARFHASSSSILICGRTNTTPKFLNERQSRQHQIESGRRESSNASELNSWQGARGNRRKNFYFVTAPTVLNLIWNQLNLELSCSWLHAWSHETSSSFCRLTRKDPT